jgi:hypothetical protein
VSFAECSYAECRGAQEMLGLAENEVKRSSLLNESVSDEEKSLVTLTPCAIGTNKEEREKLLSKILMNFLRSFILRDVLS